MQIHHFVLVAQVFVFGIVGCCEVEFHANGKAVGHCTAKATREVIGVKVLGALVGERVLHEVEGTTLRVDEGRTCHVTAGCIFVTHAAKEHRAGAEAIERLHTGIEVGDVIRTIVIGEATAFTSQR